MKRIEVMEDAMAQLKINLLGSFQISLDGTTITQFESNKVRALLAYLAVESYQNHHREKLAALFWPDMNTQDARSNLSRAIYNLREQIQDHQADPPYVLRGRDSIQFNPDSDYWLDVDLFREQLGGDKIIEQPLPKINHDQIDRLQAAVNLYQGDFMEGIGFDSSPGFDEWVWIMRQRFQRQVLNGLHLLTGFYGEGGELSKALSYAWRQVEIDPIDELACRQLMRFLAANNQRSQALTQFKRLQVMLAEELNVTPEPETIALRDQIRGAEDSAAQDQSAGDNLPALLTPLVGRHHEIVELLALINDTNCRLLTIQGPGGSGKTRLAIEIARSCGIQFRHGVYFVPLNPVQSPESIQPSIADVLELSLSDKDDHQVQLINYLRNKNLLLVLDGFEHLLDGTKMLTEILRLAYGLKVLVTSRTRLNVKGEYLYFLPGMHLPEQNATQEEILDSDAVQLLVSGLQRTQNAYRPGPEDIKYLHQICRKVQGMPLGILLAASWGATLSVAEIDVEVNRGLDFLAANWTDVPDRQRSLRATFDHSWNLLGKREQRIFQGLSVFRGAFTRQAARVVSGASPHELRALVERSLLWSKTPGWYEVHELLRQFGREKLAQSGQAEQEICARHSENYLGQLARLGVGLKSEGQVASLSSIDLEHNNFRAAWNWAASQGAAAQLAPVVDAFCLYYDLSTRYSDGENACRMAMKGLQQNPSGEDAKLLQAHISTWQSRFMRLLGQPEVASPLIENALNHLEEAKATKCQVKKVEAFIHLEQGNIHFHKDRAAAAACYRHSLEIYHALEDTWGSAKTLARLGLLAHHSGSFLEAVQRFTESLELFRENGDPRGIANALVNLGHNTQRQGQANAGLAFVEDGIEILQQIGDRAGVARGYLDLGRTCFYTGQFAKGNALFQKSFPILEDLGLRSELVYSTVTLGLGFSHNGEYAQAIAQSLKGLPMAREADARREIAAAYCILGVAYLGQGDIEQTQAWALKSIDQYQEIDQKDELGWVFALMVFVKRDLGQVESAQSYLCQTLEIGIKTHGYFSVLHGLSAAALLFLDQGEIERAVGLYALVTRFPVAANSHWFEDVAGQEIATAAESLTSEIAVTSRKRGRKRDLWKTAEELLEEFS